MQAAPPPVPTAVASIASRQAPGIVLRVYQGKRLEEATALFQRDAQAAARDGYVPANQTWQPGSRQDGVALAGIVILIASWAVAFMLPSNEVWDANYGFVGTVDTGYPSGLNVILILGGTLIGVVLTVAAFAMRRPGSLTVTYQHTASTPVPQPPPPASSSSPDLGARLATLERLHSTGAISEEEYGARRTRILDEI